MASLSPWPVMVLTPVFGAAAIASCPFCLSFSTTFDPIKLVPPITTIFMTSPLVMISRQRRHPSRSPPDRFQRRFVDSPGWISPALRLLAGCCAPQAAGRRGAADLRDELTAPHVGSQAQTTALHPLKQVLR
jgi:hypothetical protein